MSNITDAYARALARAGADVTIRRIVGASNVDATLRAAVRVGGQVEVGDGKFLTERTVVIDAKALAASGWPAGSVADAMTPDPTMPRRNDKVVINARAHNVERVDVVHVNNALARIELVVLG